MINFGGNISQFIGGDGRGTYTRTRFNVVGDLNLGAGDKIFAFGPNPLSLNVANNANLAAGSVIDLSASGSLGGAGGGGGGLPSTPVASFYQGLNMPGGRAGIAGQPGFPNFGTYEAQGGGNGQTGMGDYLSSGGAGGVGLGSIPTLTGSTPGGFAGNFNHATVARGDNGSNGGNGTNGGAGQVGGAGLAASGGYSVLYTTLRGGSGGGAGATGGNGVHGMNGGGGGGGSASKSTIEGQPVNPFNLAPRTGDFAEGGRGGSGGAGGQGGLGGIGGVGGGGGGGVELLARGAITMAGNSLLANGGNGALGSAGVAGSAGGAGRVGLAGETNSVGQVGGTGGNGGSGGTGGTGGTGGQGAGGSGGSVFMVATTLNQSGTTLQMQGGSGSAQGAAGQYLFQAYNSISGSSRVLDANGVLTENPYDSFQEGVLSSKMPNIVGLRGGADGYGILTSTARYDALRLVPFIPGFTDPLSRVAVIERAQSDIHRYTNNRIVETDTVTVTAMRDMVAPVISAISPQDADQPLGVLANGPLRLQQRGYMANPDYVPGAAGFTDIATLNRTETWAMRVDRTHPVSDLAKSYQLQVGFTPYGVQRLFTGPDTSPLIVTDNGLLHTRLQIIKAGAAPQVLHESTSETSANIRGSGFARANGSARLDINGSNVGNDWSIMPGQMSVDSNRRGVLANEVYGLYAGAGQAQAGLAVDLKGAAGSTERIRAIFANTFDDQGRTVWGYTYDVTYVSPEPTVNLARNADQEFVLDFGNVVLGGSQQLSFQFGNAAAPVAGTDLEDLSLLYHALSGGDSSQFSMLDGPSLMSIAAGGTLTRSLRFAPDHAGAFSALYLVTTDHNTDAGEVGQVFSFRLSGTAVAAVPEPSQWLMFGLGLIAVMFAKTRRHARRAA